jgi:hypothetical protein
LGVREISEEVIVVLLVVYAAAAMLLAPLIFVTATRTSRAEFEATSPLGPSLARVGQLTPLQLRLSEAQAERIAEAHARLARGGTEHR